MTFAEALAEYLKLQDIADEAAKKLKPYPKGPMGLTPDVVKFSAEYQRDHKVYKIAEANVRAYATPFLAKFKKEYREWIFAKRATRA